MWQRSRHASSDFVVNSGLVLPCPATLTFYKSCMKMQLGVESNDIKLLKDLAKIQNLFLRGYVGGLALDEMAIQPGLEFRMEDGYMKMIGYQDVEEVVEAMIWYGQDPPTHQQHSTSCTFTYKDSPCPEDLQLSFPLRIYHQASFCTLLSGQWDC